MFWSVDPEMRASGTIWGSPHHVGEATPIARTDKAVNHAQRCRIGPSCGGSPREGARSEVRAEQRLAAGGAQRSPDPDAWRTRALILLCGGCKLPRP